MACIALAGIALLGSASSHAAPPDWSKAGAAPAPSFAASSAPRSTLLAPATAMPKAGSALGSSPAPTATPMKPAAAGTFAPLAAQAVAPGRVSPPTAPNTAIKPQQTVDATTAAAGARDVYKLDDRSIIIVGGKPVSAGSIKAKLNADLAAKAGAPTVRKASPRKLDLAAINAVSATGPGNAIGSRPSQPPRPGLRATTSATGSGAMARMLCADNGPPTILEVDGKLKAGGRVTIWGSCFGDKPGRVEVIGQFAGGKLLPAFVSWDKTSITIDVPATIRGAGDHTVAVSIVTALGKTSTAAQAQFVAARERVDVPDRMWAGGPAFEAAATTDTLNTAGRSTPNPAAEGTLPKTVRINPQCSLDSMDVTSISGSVTSIVGFETGPPNEANVSIGWVGTCIDTKTTTHYNYVIALAGDDVKVTSACRVALQARAWAYCPAGVAP